MFYPHMSYLDSGQEMTERKNIKGEEGGRERRTVSSSNPAKAAKIALEDTSPRPAVPVQP